MKQSLTPALVRVFKRLHYPFDVMLMCVRWYVAYGLSVRNLEEMMAERGIEVDHSTVHRWAIKLLPVLGKAFGRRKRPVGRSWRVDETYIKVKGAWKYLYRAVDKAGHTVDFLLRAHRDKAAAQLYFEKSIDQNGEPETITIDKSGSTLAALEALNAQRGTPIKIRQNKYLNNIIEQDHRAIKRRTRPMLVFKTFRCARIVLGGIELMHMIKKGQTTGTCQTAAEQFYSLVKYALHIISLLLAPPSLLRQNPFTRTVVAEVAAGNICVSAIAPGGIRKPDFEKHFARLTDEQKNRLMQLIQAGSARRRSTPRLPAIFHPTITISWVRSLHLTAAPCEHRSI